MSGFLTGILDPFDLGGENSPPSSSPPSANQIGSEYTDLINSFESSLPSVLQTQQQYEPGFEATELQGLDEALLGTPGGTSNSVTDVYQNGWYDPTTGKLVSTDSQNKPVAGATYYNKGQSFDVSTTNPAQAGLLGTFTNDILPTATSALTTANTATRTANTNDLSTLGPQFVSAIQGSNPGMAGLTNTLTNTAQQQLNLGTQLDPNSVSQINSTVANNWANRGLGTSNPAMLDQALQLNAGGQNLLQSRESQAGAVAGLDSSLYETPELSLLGVQSGAPALSESLGGFGAQIGSGATPSIVPTSENFSALDAAFNSAAASNISNANNAAAIQSAGMEY